MAFFSNPKRKLARQVIQRLVSGHTALLALQALRHAGVLTALAEASDGLAPAAYAAETSMSPEVLEALLDYLVQHDLVTRDKERYRLSPAGEAIREFDDGMLDHVYAYQPVMLALEHLLARLKTYGHGVSRKSDALLMGQARRFAGELYPAVDEAVRGARAKCILDLACATGELLVYLAQNEKQTTGVGIGADSASIHQANELISKHTLDRRLIAVPVASLDACLDTRRAFDRAGISPQLWDKFDAVVACHWLVDLIPGGREKMLSMLRALRTSFPGAAYIFADPAAGPAFDRNPCAAEMRLLYQLSHTPLWSPEQWSELFREAGLTVRTQALLETDGLCLCVCTSPAAAVPKKAPAQAATR